jgi:hypothetical protein
MKIGLIFFMLIGLNSACASVSYVWEELPYFSAADSPFYGGIRDGSIYLEDFEDHQLNTPYVVSWDYPRSLGTLPSGGEVLSLQQGLTVRTLGAQGADSVDADDGLVGDLIGRGGDAWTTRNVALSQPMGSMDFRFERDSAGRLPTYVGFVVTEPDSYFLMFEVSMKTPGDLYNWFGELTYDPRSWTPNSFPGDTRAHRFFGLYLETGIESLYIHNVISIDHLQYGYAIPEPTTLGLLAAGIAAGWFRRRR